MESLAPAAAPTRFEAKRRVEIPALNLVVEEYVHQDTGAVHLHLASDSSENVFMVALRTVPEDSTGVAHILEHTVLCGSEQYPVRDPFFMMLRRSLNTFMNAFTSSDWTAYPFATQNRKDFGNLLSVYLDAVFFSRLDPLDFAQEGHRVEFEGTEDGDQELVFKGVVFNEMKGAMSSISSVLWDRLCFELFPSNTYHFNSGGDPENIPDLSYQQLRDFYAKHYHPSNATFLTFGDIDAAEHQSHFEQAVLSRFERSDSQIEVSLEAPFTTPRQATHHYACDDPEGTDGKTHLIMGWKLGESADLQAMVEAQVLAAILMENSASPLMQFLETTPLGSAPSPLCGVEESMREMVFCCGIEGSNPDAQAAFEAGVLGVIEQVAAEGIAAERLDAILHQIELQQRELTGDGMPYGLNLMLRALGAAVHRGDAIAALDLEPVLQNVRDSSRDSHYVPTLVRRLLLENPHRVSLVVKPDISLSDQRTAAEKERLQAMANAMDSQQRADVLDLAEKLKERQSQEDDPEILPKVTVADIPATVVEPSPRKETIQGYPVWNYESGTNGLVYQQWLKPLPELSDSDWSNLPLLSGLMTEVGIGDADYLAIQDRQSATVGSLGVSTLTRGARDDVQNCTGWFLCSSKALADRAVDQATLMQDTLQHARFDEHQRIRELVSQIRARRDQSVTGSGHSLAMAAACAGMSPIAKRSHEQGGLAGIQRIRALDEGLANEGAVEALGQELTTLRQHLCESGGTQLAVIADGDHIDRASGAALDRLGAAKAPPDKLWQPDAIREHRNEIWVTNTQVNFCARAYATVPSGHPDAPPLTVLSAFLRNGFLHRAIREQGGAYGGGASHDANIGAFRFFSYRDPRLTETLDDFEASIQWFLNGGHDDSALEEAILGVVGSLDKPGSPAGEARKHFQETLFGRTTEHRAAFRQGIVATTLDDLHRVAETYLMDTAFSTAVITNATGADKVQGLVNELALQRRELP